MTRTNGPAQLTLWHTAWIALSLLALLARLLPGERTIDDAFITFRYVENLVAGRGFVYNPGERVLGTTTPLFTLLLTAEKLVLPGARLPALARATNALAGALSVAILAWIGRHALGVPGLGLAAGLLWALSPMAVTFAIGGMETSVYVLLLLSALATYALGRSRWSALFCALATLTRPDALLLVGPLFAHMTWMRRRFPWQEAALYLALLLPWAAFATLYFGSPLPHSLIAKSVAYRIGPYSALVRLVQHYATPFFGHRLFGVRWVGVGMLLYPFLAWVGGLSMVRGWPLLNPPCTTRGDEEERAARARLWPLVLYPWVYSLALSVYNPLIFRWYLAPAIPAYVLCILVGGQRLLSDLAAIVAKPSSRRRAAADTVKGGVPTALYVRKGVEAALVLVLAAMLLNAWQAHPGHGPDRPAPEMAWFRLEQLYRRATRDLVEREPISDETRIAAGDIGVVGYESGARILDTVGLVSPEAVAYAPLPDEAYVGVYAISTELILDQRPDYLIALEVYVRNTLRRSEQFNRQYELVQRWPTDIYGSDGLLVYRRRGAGK
jgi:hypothetical protein